MGDLVRVFFEQLKELQGEAYIRNYLKYQLSPVIHRVKPAVTLNVNKEKEVGIYWLEYGESIVKELGLEYVCLRENQQTMIIMVYDIELINTIIQSKPIKRFLSGIGYTIFEATKSCEYLVERYTKYHCPHELGIFLGIPLDDVEVFMGCEKKECLLCGYWKVYNNIDYAQKQFAKYDNAKRMMIEQLIAQIRSA